MQSYKNAKEAFVSHHEGSSILHVNSLSLVALASVILHAAVETRTRDASRTNQLSGLQLPLFSADFLILTFPLLLSQTVFASQPLLLAALTAVPAVLLVLTKPSKLLLVTLLPSPFTQPIHSPSRPPSPAYSSTRHESSSSPSQLIPSNPHDETKLNGYSPPKNDDVVQSTLVLQPVPYLTTYRAHMLLMTSIAILAVDFPIFPRYLAKCESFGVSLMDIGVGSFVFAQGLASAGPILKDPSYLSKPLVPKVTQSIRKVLPVLALGLARVLLVKGTEYPEHVTEYGVHWNFFITMAVISPLAVLLHPLVKRFSIAVVGLLIIVVHELLLQTTTLQTWAIDGERIGLVSENKEGIVSLPGYLGIHTFGLLMGTLLLPPSPSTFRHMQKRLNNRSLGQVSNEGSRSQPDKAAIELFSYAAAWWSLLGIAALSLPLYASPTSTYRAHSVISRRVANMPYVLWIAAYNTSFLLGYLLVDTAFFHIREPDKFPYSKKSSKNREESPSRKDRGSLLSPTEAAAGFSQSYSRTPNPIITNPSSPKPGLKRSNSKRAIHSNSTEDNVASNNFYASFTDRPAPAPPRRGPELLEAINRNGLGFFLLANVATGLVNLTFQTMYASDGQALCILVSYCFVVCGAAWLVRGRRLW